MAMALRLQEDLGQARQRGAELSAVLGRIGTALLHDSGAHSAALASLAPAQARELGGQALRIAEALRGLDDSLALASGGQERRQGYGSESAAHAGALVAAGSIGAWHDCGTPGTTIAGASVTAAIVARDDRMLLGDVEAQNTASLGISTLERHRRRSAQGDGISVDSSGSHDHAPDTIEMRRLLEQLDDVQGTIRALDELIEAGGLALCCNAGDNNDYHSLNDMPLVAVEQPVLADQPQFSLPRTSGHSELVGDLPLVALDPPTACLPSHGWSDMRPAAVEKQVLGDQPMFNSASHAAEADAKVFPGYMSDGLATACGVLAAAEAATPAATVPGQPLVTQPLWPVLAAPQRAAGMPSDSDAHAALRLADAADTANIASLLCSPELCSPEAGHNEDLQLEDIRQDNLSDVQRFAIVERAAEPQEASRPTEKRQAGVSSTAMLAAMADEATLPPVARVAVASAELAQTGFVPTPPINLDDDDVQADVTAQMQLPSGNTAVEASRTASAITAPVVALSSAPAAVALPSYPLVAIPAAPVHAEACTALVSAAEPARVNHMAAVPAPSEYAEGCTALVTAPEPARVNHLAAAPAPSEGAEGCTALVSVPEPARVNHMAAAPAPSEGAEACTALVSVPEPARVAIAASPARSRAPRRIASRPPRTAAAWKRLRFDKARDLRRCPPPDIETIETFSQSQSHAQGKFAGGSVAPAGVAEPPPGAAPAVELQPIELPASAMPAVAALGEPASIVALPKHSSEHALGEVSWAAEVLSSAALSKQNALQGVDAQSSAVHAAALASIAHAAPVVDEPPVAPSTKSRGISAMEVSAGAIVTMPPLVCQEPLQAPQCDEKKSEEPPAPQKRSLMDVPVDDNINEGARGEEPKARYTWAGVKKPPAPKVAFVPPPAPKVAFVPSVAPVIMDVSQMDPEDAPQRGRQHRDADAPQCDNGASCAASSTAARGGRRKRLSTSGCEGGPSNPSSVAPASDGQKRKRSKVETTSSSNLAIVAVDASSGGNRDGPVIPTSACGRAVRSCRIEQGTSSTLAPQAHGAIVSRENDCATNIQDPLQVLFTGFARGDLQRFKRYVSRLGGVAVRELPPVASGIDQAAAVRVVARAGSNVCRTMKYYDAILAGSWLLSSDWIVASNTAGRWLSEEPYRLGVGPRGAPNAPVSGSDDVSLFKGFRLHFLATTPADVQEASSDRAASASTALVSAASTADFAPLVKVGDAKDGKDDSRVAGPKPGDLERLASRGGAQVLSVLRRLPETSVDPPRLSAETLAAAMAVASELRRSASTFAAPASRSPSGRGGRGAAAVSRRGTVRSRSCGTLGLAAPAAPWWRRPIAVVSGIRGADAAATALASRAVASGWIVAPVQWFLDCISAGEIVPLPEEWLEVSAAATSGVPQALTRGASSAYVGQAIDVI